MRKKFNIFFAVILVFCLAFLARNIFAASTKSNISIPSFDYGGKVSYFGGPGDIKQINRTEAGSISEPLAYYNSKNMSSAPAGLFLSDSDSRIVALKQRATALGTTVGTARYLNPDSYYVAMRFPKGTKPGPVVITAPNGKSVVCQVVDWGPNASLTGRDVDLSPGAIKALGLVTDQKVQSVVVADKTAKLGPTSGSGAISDATQTSQKETTKKETQATDAVSSGVTSAVTSVTGASSGTNAGGGGMLWDSRDRYCHKHTGSASPKELKEAMTCNAGYYCWYTKHGYQCNYVQDCGPKGVNCNNAQYAPPNTTFDGPQAGCLNYKCRNKPNAIWDMGSKKCGCG